MHNVRHYVLIQLRLLVRDSKADASQALSQVYDLTTRDPIAIIGPASSQPTKEVTTWLSKLPNENRAVVGYSATSAEFSSSKFKNFVRTPPADDVEAQMMVSLMAGLLVLGLI